MCNQPGMPTTGYQEGGEVDAEEIRTGMIGGRQVTLPGEGEDIAGITDLAYSLAAEGVELPEQIVAGFSPDQRLAFDLARQGVGSYKPFLEEAERLTQTGVRSLQGAEEGTLELGEQIPGQVAPGQEKLRDASGRAITSGEFGMGAAQAGIAGLQPGAARAYMNEFEDAAIQQALADVARQGELQQQNIRGQAVQSGAFGGSRQAVAEQELNRNVLEQQARTAAQMRQAGFESAANRALTAAQATGQLGQMGSQAGLNAATAAGNLGLQSSQLGLSGIQAGLGAQQQAAGIGQGIAGLGQQMVGIGQAGQQMNLQDINTLLTTGGAQQRQGQAQIDAAYQNQYQQAMQPYQQLAFASDIITGAPSGQASTMSQPGPSIGSQILGLGMAAPAVYQGWQGMMGNG